MARVQRPKINVVRRRSIVTFEKWLDEEIRGFEQHVAAVEAEQSELVRKREIANAKLMTLRAVKEKLGKTAFPAVKVIAEDGEPTLLDGDEFSVEALEKADAHLASLKS